MNQLAKVGVLVIAHGSKRQQWVDKVDKAVALASFPCPVVTCFLEMVEGRTIRDGVQCLEQMGVKRVLVLPLFVSSGSTHIQEIRSMFGLSSFLNIREKDPFFIPMEVSMLPTMDDHPLVVSILIERAKELSRDPEKEALLLIGHGSDAPHFHALWEKGMQSLVKKIRQHTRFKEVSYATIHPDTMYARGKACRHSLLVVPVFLSEGYFTRQVIPSKMEGLEYRYNGKTYLPHPLVSTWMESVVRDEIENQEKVRG